MTIKELSEINFRYVRIRLDRWTDRYENKNFTYLLQYIGEHYPINGRNPIGCAYKKIQKETDNLLHVSWGCNWELRTSKREISSIRLAKYWLIEKKENHYYIRIPYKISYIFTAISNIVFDLSNREPIPEELKACINTAYGLSFYKLHIEEYDRMYMQKFKEDANLSDAQKYPSLLHDEFHSPINIFQTTFPSNNEVPSCLMSSKV